jgi:alkyl hydroperoxide reductase subunit AhpF
MSRYSVFSLIANALNGQKGWTPAWRDAVPKPSYDVIIVGGGGHGLATAYYLAKEHGIRNSTLMAIMPAETSAQIANATNGIEPPRSYISVKQSKHGVLKQVVPEFSKLKNKYELLWDQKSPE